MSSMGLPPHAPPADKPEPQEPPVQPTPPAQPAQSDPGDEDAPMGERHPDPAPPEAPVTQSSES